MVKIVSVTLVHRRTQSGYREKMLSRPKMDKPGQG